MADAEKDPALHPSVCDGTVEHPPAGLTLEALAEAKRLPVDLLKQLGCRSTSKNGSGAVRIPYHDESGVVVAVRSRLSMTAGARFKWRVNDKVHLYGLDRLSDARRAGWVLVVEGESDCWTAWHHDLPCIGVPGKSTWSGERGRGWAAKLAGLRVYLWQEPEAEDLAAAVGKDIPEVAIIAAPEGVKDLSEAHIAGHDVPAYLEDLKAAAVPFAELDMARRDASLADAMSRAAEVLAAADPLELVRVAVVDSGYGGDVQPAILTYLALTSRVLAMRRGAMPVHLLLVGPPSAGKSFTLQTCLSLLPEEAYHVIDAGSPRVLIYDDADLVHRAVIFGEADSLPAGEDNPAASAVRNLLQDHELHYSVVVRDTEGGRFVKQEVNKPGPSVLITTAVRRLGAQLDSRLFILDVPDDQTQIASTLRAQAAQETHPRTGEIPDALVAYQQCLQALAPWEVAVPFAGELAEAIARQPNDARVGRDFARLLSLIKTVAVMRHARRERDDAGRLVATLDDYATVHALVADVYRASSTGAGAKIRAVVEAVAAITATRPHATQTQVRERLSLPKSAASRHVNAALRNGWLTNTETRKGYPAQLTIGEPLPPETGLPDPDALNSSTVPDRLTGRETPEPVDLQEVHGECSTVPPLTDDRDAGCAEVVDPDLLCRAASVAVMTGAASVSLITKRCTCTPAEATAVLDHLEAVGVVGPANGGTARPVLVEVVSDLPSLDAPTSALWTVPEGGEVL